MNRPPLRFASSIHGLADGFAWAKDVALSWVRTGSAPGVLPSYWAGLTDRPMFYSRDVAHQAVAGHLLGLDEENVAMLQHFAASATEQRRYYPLWAFMFDGESAALDYHSDDHFVRETPAAFEVAQKALDLYRWTGDRRYVTDPVFFDYYRHLFDFVDLHDVQGLGLAGEQETIDIFDGSPTYNEHAGLPDLQIAGDGVACQWAAMRAIADVFGAEGTEPELAARAASEADRIRETYATDWWDEQDQHYIVGLTKTGRATGFSSEASWFPMVKRMVPDGERIRSHLDQLRQRLRTEPPRFLESSSYLAEAFFAYGYDDEALHWIRYLIESKSDYPEIPFTVISHLATGLTGIEPGADGALVTRSHLPTDAWVEVSGIPFRSGTISLRHVGTTSTELTLSADAPPLRWEARFADGSAQTVDVQPGTMRSARA